MGLQRVRHDWALNNNRLFVHSIVLYKWDYTVCILFSSFFHSTLFLDLSTLLYAPKIHYFLLLSSIPLYCYITICLSIHLSMGIWVVFCVCLVAQSCLTLCDPMDCNLPDSSVHGDFPGKNTGVGCHALIQGICLAQGSNPGLAHCRWILYHLSHQGSL